MTTISAKIIADSVSPDRIRITTMQLRYPRFIHAELMTHRVFSRNASSSRAVPVEKTIKWVLEDTAMPMHWGANQKGMQAEHECNERIELWLPTNGGDPEKFMMTREEVWFEARDRAIEIAQAYNTAGYHKQIVNRLLEPFAHINVLVTSTYWANWYALRNHKAAMPEIQILAQRMLEAQKQSTPKLLHPGEWHVPYVVPADWEVYPSSQTPDELIKVSVARSARVSYLTTDEKKPDLEADLALYDRLVGGEPLHASPAEHQATPDEEHFKAGVYYKWRYPYQHGNLYGWRQYRKMLPGEFQNEYDNYDPVAEAERLPWGFVA